MKTLYILIICLFGLLSSCDFVDPNQEPIHVGPHVRDEDYEKIANGITYRVGKQLKKDINLQYVGGGGGMMDSIRMMAMSFQLFHEVDLPEARRILVCATTEYLNAINDSKRVRPYLRNYPFKVENIEIMIWVQTANNRDVAPDEIAFMSSDNGILIYKIVENRTPYTSKEIHQETYQEALKIIQEEDAANPNKPSLSLKK